MKGFRLGLLSLLVLVGCADTPDRTAQPPTTSTIGVTPPAVRPTHVADPSPLALPSPTSGAATPIPSTNTPAPTATFVPATVEPGTPAPSLPGNLITQTVHLDIYRLEGSLPVPALLELAPQFEEAIAHVGARVGTRLIGRVAISFEPPQEGPCALRGLTFSHDRTIHLYYGPEAQPETVLAIVAHELAHQLQHDRYGWEAHQRSDVILLEGHATWASGDYAQGEDGRPSWAGQAEQALADGSLLPLTANLEADCRTSTRRAAYTGWASFVDFLIAVYGRERFDQLYQSGKGRAPGSSDYVGVYGKHLELLDHEWREWLAAGTRSP